MVRDVLVVIGTSGMGRAIARRQAASKQVLLADYDETTLRTVTDAMADDGHTVLAATVDVSARESVVELAKTAESLGPVTHIVHTAGLSPAQAPAAAILRVDLRRDPASVAEFGVEAAQQFGKRREIVLGPVRQPFVQRSTASSTGRVQTLFPQRGQREQLGAAVVGVGSPNDQAEVLER